MVNGGSQSCVGAQSVSDNGLALLSASSLNTLHVALAPTQPGETPNTGTVCNSSWLCPKWTDMFTEGWGNRFVVGVSDTTTGSRTLRGRLHPSVTEFMLALTTTGRRGAKERRMVDSLHLARKLFLSSNDAQHFHINTLRSSHQFMQHSCG